MDASDHWGTVQERLADRIGVPLTVAFSTRVLYSREVCQRDTGVLDVESTPPTAELHLRIVLATRSGPSEALVDTPVRLPHGSRRATEAIAVQFAQDDMVKERSS